MFSLDDSLFYDLFYVNQYNSYLKIVGYFWGVFLSFEILRNQVSEVNVLQLVPGVYFLIFILFLLILLFLSNSIFEIAYLIDSIKGYGTKTLSKSDINIFFRYGFSLLFFVLFLAINNFIPLTLDSLTFSGERTLENIWSFIEVILLEIILVIILVTISQIPLFFFLKINTQILTKNFTTYWKVLSFLLTFLSGLLTPTLDAYTQINFATSIFSFYLLITNFVQKRTFLKTSIFLSLL